MANPNPKTEHLEATKWKPGQTGNPQGHNKKARFTNALIKMLDEKGLDDPFVRAGITQALKGDFNFWKYIYDRVEGKIPIKLEQSEPLEAPDAEDEDGNQVDP